MIYFFIILPYLAIFLTKLEITAYVAIVCSAISTCVLFNSMIIGEMPNNILNATSLLIGLPTVIISLFVMVDSILPNRMSTTVLYFTYPVICIIMLVAVGNVINVIVF